MPIQPVQRTRRRKTTPWHVRFTDALASKVITLGGIGTVAAVLLVVVVLVVNVIPLFYRATLTPLSTWQSKPVVDAAVQPSSPGPLHMACDEYGSIVWTLDSSGRVQFNDLRSGTPVWQTQIPLNNPDGDRITAVASDESGNHCLIGTHSGQVQSVEVAFETTFVDANALSPADRNSLESGSIIRDRSLLQWVAGDLLRKVTPKDLKLGEPRSLSTKPIERIELGPKLTSPVPTQAMLVLVGDQLIYAVEKVSTNMLTKKPKVEFRSHSVETLTIVDKEIIGMMLTDRGDRSLLVSKDGRVHIYEHTLNAEPRLIDSIPLDIPTGHQPTVACRLLGRGTMMIGDSSGQVLGVFLAKAENASEEANPERLVAVHRVQTGATPIRRLVPSPALRLIATAEDSGKVSLLYVPTDQTLASLRLGSNQDTDFAFSPRGDRFLTRNGQEIAQYRWDPGYPEASLRSLFGHLWYEGYNAPRYIWQSTATSAATETKLSMMPLVFGTLKATFYTLLISVPLAIMAAIYSSEFMDRKWRGRVKPAIELMASIPSVVLGFTSAFVLAPWLRDSLDWALTAFFLIPLGYLLAAHLWCLLPVNALIRLNWLRLPMMAAVLPIAVGLAKPMSPWIQSLLLGTDLKTWLSGEAGYAYAGWFLLLLPLSTLAISFVMMVVLGPATRSLALKFSPFTFALFNLVRFALGVLAVFITSYCAAELALWLVGDVRGSIYGMYQERNAFLVGAVLGFAVIPIIYTISEDALQAVPQHLRSASLGCGATPWQTTIRVVVPTAMSGLFSAVMIGFGRAVGETMVVLMAAGNTPVMDINPFNGYRTLSATLATELPEAAAGSAHFRTLFLAALLLFFMTLLANSAAEIVRMRFRKRAYQL